MKTIINFIVNVTKNQIYQTKRCFKDIRKFESIKTLYKNDV